MTRTQKTQPFACLVVFFVCDAPVRAVNARARAHPEALLIAGDHNLWRHSARALYSRDLRALRTSPTWPAPRPQFTIDHVWVRGFTGQDRTRTDTGSDHMAVDATLCGTC